MRSAIEAWPAPSDLDRSKCKMILPAQPSIRRAQAAPKAKFHVVGEKLIGGVTVSMNGCCVVYYVLMVML